MSKVAIVFPGQGSQYIGMGKSLCEKSPIANRIFEEASESLKFDLKRLCFEGNISELTKTENAQPAILTASVAAFKVYMDSIGIKPYLALGHSLGEISALTCVGAINFIDAVKIARFRGMVMQEAVAFGEGAMKAVIGIDRELVQEECRNASAKGNIVVIANYNSNNQIVISGNRKAVEKVEGELERKGGKILSLNVSAPFHCPLMEPAAAKLEEELRKYKFKSFICPVISNVTAEPYSEPVDIIGNLVKQVYRPVKWSDSMMYIRDNAEYIVEIGPKTVLKSLAKNEVDGTSIMSMDDSKDFKKILNSLGMKKQEESSKKNFLSTCLAISASTKNSNWNNDEYNNGVVKQYRMIEKMQEKLDSENKEPTYEQMKEGFKALEIILKTKKVPLQERTERLKQVVNEAGIETLL